MNAPAAAPPFGLPLRRALARAALVLWLPVLVPVVTGMLRGSDHAATGYLLSAPVVPGILAPVLLGLDDAAFFVCGGAVTLALCAGLALALHELPRALARVLEVVVVLLIAFEAIGFAHALRA